MKLKALIVDDEYPARQELRYALEGIDEIEIVGEAANAQEALALIRALDYQILFLDISMPGMSGLELGAAIQELPRKPYIIFVTAYDEYAVSAFEVNAVDYILKPVEPKRLKKAVDKVVRLLAEPSSAGGNGGPAGKAAEAAAEVFGQFRLDRIPAEKNGKTVLVNEADIVYAFTEMDSVYIKTHSDKLVTRYTLKDLAARLNPQVFFRTHRCYVVNLRKVKEIIPFFNGTLNLVVEDKEHSEVPVSRAQAKKLRKILGI